MLRDTRGFYTFPTLLAGSLDTGSQFFIGGSMEPLAVKKFENLSEYLTIYPEYQYIFIGDNGQGDVRTVEMILSSKELSHNLQRAYIHEVQPLHLTYAKHAHTKSRTCPKICYFNTYIDAALDAYRYGILSAASLRRIAVESVEEFEAISGSAWSLAGAGIGGGGRLRDARLRELNQSIHTCAAVLLSEGLAPVRSLKFAMTFAPGRAVRCVYGVGVVERFRAIDGVYEVCLCFGERSCRRDADEPVPIVSTSSSSSSSSSSAKSKAQKTQHHQHQHRLTREQEAAVSHLLRSIVQSRCKRAYLQAPALIGLKAPTNMGKNCVMQSIALVPLPTPAPSSLSSSSFSVSSSSASSSSVALPSSTLSSLVSSSSVATAVAMPLLSKSSVATSASAAPSSSASTASSSSSSSSTQRIDCSKSGELAALDLSRIAGAVLWTPYGLAVVLSINKKDSVVVCRLSWGATAYLNSACVVLLWYR